MAQTSWLVVFLGVLACGCTTVKPWERGRLASPAMNVRFGDVETSEQYRGKHLESRTATGTPGTAPGGGCGCSQ
jgi:hypothetical protein